MKSLSEHLQKINAEQSLFSKFCLDNAALCFFRHDSHGRFLYANPLACQCLGYSLEELLNMSVIDIDPTITHDNWPNIWQTMCERKSIIIEAVHRRKDGTTFPVEVNANLLECEGELFAASFVHDITERIKAREDLLLTKFFFDKAAIGIFRYGVDARVLNVNEQACKSLGYTEAELYRMTIYDIDPNVDSKNWSEMWQNLCEVKTSNFETVHCTKNGVAIPVEITSNLLEYGGEKYSISFVQDISERKNNCYGATKIRKNFRFQGNTSFPGFSLTTVQPRQ